ncbi:hypothetical protein QTJ16_002354 [Diplocarpon rosae]|uniref:Fungal N-terminal domain-containing protein n=1 Tax=Diplocarpon rosae TaxID=946125 RepID=A0AAD9WEX9_9HELO|nr:hypothetical protein QTJ16_002354 [Diplocarpon rosae]PBP25575.1 hypothetical protein BUE80_DR003500 [Diplocarpon rosae]
MSFGFSVGDIILLIQLAHKNVRNCKEAGGEYLEIAREVRSLHSVLQTVREEVERKDSLFFSAGPEKTRELTSIVEGCKGVLEGIDALLTKYQGLAPDNLEVGKAAKLWHRWKFGTEIEDLGRLRWKVITYTSTLAVLVDSIHMKATERVGGIAGRIESQVEFGFAELQNRLAGFEDMRKAVLFIATRARASERYQAMTSVLSLSTYPDDDKQVWRQFRSQLVSLGFRSDSLDRHMEVLKAYMMKLDQTGVLDEAVEQSSSTTYSWCSNAAFRGTNLSLLGTAETGEQSHESGLEHVDPLNPLEHEMAGTRALEPDVAREYSGMNVSRVALSSPATSDTTAHVRRRIPRIKLEQLAATVESDVERKSPTVSQTGDTSIENSEGQVPSVGEPEAEVYSGIEMPQTLRPRPYAESYYSSSEAATSQSTLSIDLPSSMKISSSPREMRPPNSNRPNSWAGPESRGSKMPGSHPDSGGDSHSDDTIRRSRTAPRSREERANRSVSSEQKVDDWLNLPGKTMRTPASNFPTQQQQYQKPQQQNPFSRSNEELGERHSVRNSVYPNPSLPQNHENLDSPIFTARRSVRTKVEDKNKSVRFVIDEDMRRNSGKTRESVSERVHKDSRAPSSKGQTKDDLSSDYWQTRFRSPEATGNGKSVSPSQFQAAAKAALLAGATEAFRVRNVPGSWGGEKAKRILTAAIGAGGVAAAASDVDTSDVEQSGR